MSRRAYIFVGPTIPAADVRDVAPQSVLLPPVAGGDLLRLDIRPGDRVVIIDGYFYQSLAVRHKEILSLLDRGIEVMGAASMGALRAAELALYGMRGYGRIFEAYSRGEIEGDDEVAVLHGPAEEGYPSLSEALVNVRHTCRKAHCAGIITRDTAEHVVEAARALPFHKRAYPAIWKRIADAGVDRGETALLAEFVARDGRNLKQEDARLLLESIGKEQEAEPPSSGKSFVFHETDYFRHWRQEVTGRQVEGAGFVTDREVLGFCQLFGSDYPGFHYRSVLESIASDYASECGIVVDEERVLAEFRRCEGMADDTRLAAWLADHSLTLAELTVHLQEQARIEALARGRRHHAESRAPDQPALEALVAEYGLSCRLFGEPGHEPDWMRPWLTQEEERQLTRTQQFAKIAARASCFTRCRVEWRAALIRRLKMSGVFRTALHGIVAARGVHAIVEPSLPPWSIQRIPTDRLLCCFRGRWGCSDDESGAMALLDRGFADPEEFARHARAFYLYDQVCGLEAALPVMQESQPAAEKSMIEVESHHHYTTGLQRIDVAERG